MEHESSFDELSKEGNMCNCGLDLDSDRSDLDLDLRVQVLSWDLFERENN